MSSARSLLSARRAPRARRGESGAVAVEAGIVSLLLITLLFGIIEFGLLFKDYLSVTSASRAGVRMASAEPRFGGDATGTAADAQYAVDAAGQVLREGAALNWDDISEIWVYKADGSGNPLGGGSSFSSCSNCVKFSVNGPDPEDLTVTSNSWPASTHVACASATRDSVGVYVEYDHPAITGLFFDDYTLSDHTVMAFEPMADGNTAEPCR